MLATLADKMSWIHSAAGRRILGAMLALIAVCIFSLGNVASASGGDGNHFSTQRTAPRTQAGTFGVDSASCPSNSIATPPLGTAPIYYVNTTGSVNVRKGPGTSYCVITTQGPTADEVAVPNVAVSCDGTFCWREVAFYQGACRTCTNYSWSKTGWIVSSNLTRATQGYQCVASSCGLYDSGGDTHFSVVWDVYDGPFPNPSSCPADDGNGQTCTSHGNGYQRSASGSREGVVASVYNPNWFYLSFSDFQREFYWNYDWWAH
jgi:hypothetical protein